MRCLFPLDCSGGLRGQVEEDAVDAGDFGGDAGGDVLEKVEGDVFDRGGHGVAGNIQQNNDITLEAGVVWNLGGHTLTVTLAGKVWQYFTIVPDFKSTGVRDGLRSYDWPVVIRAVNTRDAMTATVENIPFDLLQHITSRITTEVPGVNRVLYDLTPKPSGTIEWE